LARKKSFPSGRRRGWEAEDIATKRTLYHHFNSKDQLLAHVLGVQHQLALQAHTTRLLHLRSFALGLVARLVTVPAFTSFHIP
jgi:AcrR family transcriptional regulator